MLPPQQSRPFHLSLHPMYANQKYITHKMWRTVTTSYGVPLMILIHSAQTKKEPSTRWVWLNHIMLLIYSSFASSDSKFHGK